MTEEKRNSSINGDLVFKKVVDGLALLAVLIVHTADSVADVADLLVVKALGSGSQGFGGDGLLPVCTHEHHPVTGLDTGNIRHIHHQLIHANSAQNGGFFPVDQHIEPTGKASAIAVGIAHGDGGDHRLLVGNISTAVADGLYIILTYRKKHVQFLSFYK